MPLTVDGKKGSITVESAIIVPFILLMLIAVILSFLIMYQKALLTHTASMAAKQAAERWKKGEHIPGEDGLRYAEKLSLRHLYVGFLENFNSNLNYSEMLDLEHGSAGPESMQDSIIQYVRSMVLSELKASVIEPAGIRMDVFTSGGILQKKLVVELKQKIQLPMGSVVSFFTGSDSFQLTARGTAVREYPAEFIRNVDLVMEYVGRLGAKFDPGGILDELKRKVLNQ